MFSPGATVAQLYNASAVSNEGDWWFMSAGDSGGGGQVGWAAVRVAWGAMTNLTATTAPLLTVDLSPADTWAPLVRVASYINLLLHASHKT